MARVHAAHHRRSSLLLLGALVAATGLAGAGCSAPGDDPGPSGSGPSAAASTAAATAEQLAAAVVRLAPTDAAGNECWWGSGTLIDASGTILTNFHVVENVPSQCDYQRLVVSVTDRTDQPPTPAYLGAVHAMDPVADLAVVRITSGLHGEAVTPDLPFIPVGDSDTVGLGDSLRILGYPGIGGDTITFTDGRVAGFLSDSEHGDRAWIKTAATVAGGNSGGTALDSAGRLIGVPTRSSPGDTSQAVDCRIVSDTNGDGQVTEDDTCVPIGGFINGLRPVNLASGLIARAADSGPIAVAELSREPAETPEPSAEGPVIRALVLSSAVDEDGNPEDRPVTLPSGSPSVCGSFEYENMVDGTTYDLIWTRDGEISDGASVRGDRWSGGASGSWYICATGGQGGLSDGLWELGVYVDAEIPSRTESIFLGDDYTAAQLEIVNGLSEKVCYLRVSPSASGWWGQDELGSQTLEPGQHVTVAVAAPASYDIRASDCDDDVLVDLDDIDTTGFESVTLE